MLYAKPEIYIDVIPTTVGIVYEARVYIGSIDNVTTLQSKVSLRDLLITVRDTIDSDILFKARTFGEFNFDSDYITDDDKKAWETPYSQL